MKAPTEELLRFYLDELSHLRQMGRRFAEQYPKVASRLELHAGECPDPHVERLIESFAFLAARIQADLATDFPQIAAELLDVLYPHYLQPVPSMTIAQFVVDPDKKMGSSHTVKRETHLFTHGERNELCRFRTVYPVELWPVTVTEVEVSRAEAYTFIKDPKVLSVLRVRLETGESFEGIEERNAEGDKVIGQGIDKLRFYLNGEAEVVSRLYEAIFDATRSMAVCVPDEEAQYLPKDSWRQVGFGRDEGAIPYPRQSHPAYRLLQEYFTFPEKFHFVDICNLRGRAKGKVIDLLFLLDRRPPRITLAPETFALGCTPVVNLFTKLSEPVRIDHRQLEYKLVPDYRREKTMEVHSITSVSGTSDLRDASRQYAPFYAYTHAMQHRGRNAYWHARRQPTIGADASGTDVYLSFRDDTFQFTRPADEIVFAHLLCTNRALAAELPSQQVLQTDEAIDFLKQKKGIICLKKPTRPISPYTGQELWRLVSHLSLNFLSLDDDNVFDEDTGSLGALHSVLGLYCFSDDQPSLRQQVTGIRAMKERKVLRRMSGRNGTGFVRGTEVDLTFDPNVYVGSSSLLFASVLREYFALHASINSFTQLVIRREGGEGIWKRWPPMAGETDVL
jgi:type VI secretion system protein ImpG